MTDETPDKDIKKDLKKDGAAKETTPTAAKETPAAVKAEAPGESSKKEKRDAPAKSVDTIQTRQRDQRNQGRDSDSEWKEKVIQIRRVTKVVKGGKKMSFRAVVVVGNGNGQVGMGTGKSNEVIGAIQKGVADAKKNLIDVPIHKNTIPHDIRAKASGSRIVMRPASEGTGVIAGGAARAVFELAGIGNILSKSLGSNSPLNVARAAIDGLGQLRSFRDIAQSRGMSVKEMLN